MVRSQRMQVVVDLASKKENEAAQKLADIKSQLAQENSRLHDLNDYYANYENTQKQLAVGVNAQDLQKMRHFLQQLNTAKQAQQFQITQVQQQVEVLTQAWRTCYLERTAMENLVVRLKLDEQAVLDKQEQKMLDEWFNGQSQSKHSSKAP